MFSKVSIKLDMGLCINVAELELDKAIELAKSLKSQCTSQGVIFKELSLSGNEALKYQLTKDNFSVYIIVETFSAIPLA